MVAGRYPASAAGEEVQKKAADDSDPETGVCTGCSLVSPGPNQGAGNRCDPRFDDSAEKPSVPGRPRRA
jgi:hypothetical protein